MRRHYREFAFAFVFLSSIAIGLLRPFSPELDVLGHSTLAVLICTTGLWIFEPFGLSVGISSCCMFALTLLVGLPTETVFSGFSQTSVWTMIPTLFFGYVLKKTGLGKRMAYLLLRQIHTVTYPKLILCWSLLGILLSFFTPSITVRVILIIPLALECVQLCGIPKHSRGRSLLLLTAWAMAVIPGIGWSTGSLMGPILTGIFSTVDALPDISFSVWFQVMFLPAMLVSLLLVSAGALILRPRDSLRVEATVFETLYQQLPPLSRPEKISAIVLCSCFLLFATGTVHQIPDVVICLLGFFILCTCRIIQPAEISTGISWDIVLFVGASMSLGSIFTASGLSDWFSKLLFPLFGTILQNPWVFMPVMLTLLFLWRFIDVALLTPTIVVLSSVLPDLKESYGLSPLAWLPLFCFAICSFFLKYENMFLLIGEDILQDNGWTGKDRSKYATVYFAACLVTILAMIPYWTNLGLFNN